MKKIILIVLTLLLLHFAVKQGWVDWIKTHSIKIMIEKKDNNKTSVAAVRGDITKSGVTEVDTNGRAR